MLRVKLSDETTFVQYISLSYGMVKLTANQVKHLVAMVARKLGQIQLINRQSINLYVIFDLNTSLSLCFLITDNIEPTRVIHIDIDKT